MDKRWEELFKLRSKTSLKIIKKTLRDIKFSKSFKIINVVGTNGKGSTVNMLSKAFQQEGNKVGVFTSPHIRVPNERIKINEKKISNKDFFKIYDRFETGQFFSNLFIVAMKYFQEQNVDIAIIEAGIGGARDSTKAVDGEFGLLTSIGMDHTEYLGNNHQKIFDDKIGIANKNMSFYIPSSLPKDIKIRNSLKVINNDGPTFEIRNFNLVKTFLKENFSIILKKMYLPKGRVEKKNINGYECIFDVGHNLDGIKATLEYLKYKGIEFDDVILSLSKTKNVENIIELFKEKEIRYYKPDNSFRDFNFEEIKDIKRYKPNAKTLFIGSFRLIGALYE